MSAEILDAKPHIEKVATGLSGELRNEIANRLGAVLGDTILLQVKSQVYHWNVVGPTFFSLHTLTEEHYNDLFAAVDVIAERIRALGHVAPLNFDSLTHDSKITEESSKRSAGEMVEQLIVDHEKIVRRIRQTAAFVEENDDFATHDMLVARLAFHEKAIWMFRAIVS